MTNIRDEEDSAEFSREGSGLDMTFAISVRHIREDIQ